MTYQIHERNGDRTTVSSMRTAIATSRRILGVRRVYRGAKYQTDCFSEDGNREFCTGMDIWRSRADAKRETSKMANVWILSLNITDNVDVDAAHPQMTKQTAHKTGYHVYLHGEKSWHRSLEQAIAKAQQARRWCQNPHVIEVATGELKYGRAE